jgi:predicted transcriptional regulator
MGHRKVDWSEVEPLYRAGVLSVSEIARQFKITETAVRKHAKQHKWKRDLAAKVRAKTTQKLIED